MPWRARRIDRSARSARPIPCKRMTLRADRPVTVTGMPTWTPAHDPARRAWPAFPACRPSRSRNSAFEPELTICPASTLRASTRPAAGARMSSRPSRADCSRYCAWARRTAGVGAVARGRARIDVGLRDEAARDQRLRAIEIALRELGVGDGGRRSAPASGWSAPPGRRDRPWRASARRAPNRRRRRAPG